jgi:predicted membrane protein (TIGR00267 family)
MSLVRHVNRMLAISGSGGIFRRYLVVNGFDGALTMLGLIIGFLVSATTDLTVIVNACLAAAIALGMSGISSAWVSEVAERKRALAKLEDAMITDLKESTHGAAVHWVPPLVALVNGGAPLLISLMIIAPLWLARSGVPLPMSPLHLAIAIAAALIFVLGVMLGRIADVSWLGSGLRTVAIAAVTVTLIYFFTE